MTNTQDLRNAIRAAHGSEIIRAIEQSKEKNEIVRVDVASCDCVATLAHIARDYSDHVECEKESDGTYDMWGWSQEMQDSGAENDMEWRAKIRFCKK
jgi:hypothetical protein